MYLIAADTSTLAWLWVILQVAAGLGAVIFVHELGHFLVAKACGVKCEKFYIGFDIGGYKICHRWGETEYGIGILPLGGYVKMLGQDDNPARIAEESERSKIRESETREEPSDEATKKDEATKEEDYVLDPRSYMAKSVPQRMAIISAGVVMNLIFALVFAVIAYGMGVKYLPAIISEVIPGSPAWRADLRPGDHIIKIGDLKNPRFRDLQSRVALGNMEQGVPMMIKRQGYDEPLSMMLRPEHGKGLVPTIGVASPLTLILAELRKGWPSASATPELMENDRIVAVGDEPVAKHVDLLRLLSQHPGEPLRLKVLRGSKITKDDPEALPGDVQETGTEEVVVTVPANPMKRLGLVMQLGPITAVQAGSPAADAGLVPGDVIVEVDGAPVGDPITLPERLRRRAMQDEAVTLTVERTTAQGQSERREKTIPLRRPTTFETAATSDAPISIPALGLTCHVLNRIVSVVPDSPADKAGIASGDVLVRASFFTKMERADQSRETARLVKRKPIEFNDENRNWPAMVNIMQSAVAGVQVRLTVLHSAEERGVDLTPEASGEWFNPDRGFFTKPLRYTRQAETLGEQMQLGFEETQDSVLMVFRFLQKLLDGQISGRALGGPITIAKAAGYSAFDGMASLLVFLTMLSANLAVINFLPIPLLDGGHMVFLTLEAIFRRPVSEKIVIAFHTIGFVFIISLMLFVLALDFGLISRFPQ